MHSVNSERDGSTVSGGQKGAILIVLASFRSEGTPRLALDLCHIWLSKGIKPAILNLQRAPDDLQSSFDALGVPIYPNSFTEAGYWIY